MQPYSSYHEGTVGRVGPVYYSNVVRVSPDGTQRIIATFCAKTRAEASARAEVFAEACEDAATEEGF